MKKYTLTLFFFTSMLASKPVIYGPDSLVYHAFFLFFDENKVSLKLLDKEGECDGYNGNFSENQDLNTIHLYNLKENCSQNPIKDINCEIINIQDSIYFTQKIKCDNNQEYFNHQKPTQKGLIKYYNETIFESMGLKKAFVNSNVVLRERPFNSSTKFICYFENLPTNSNLKPGNYSFIPKNYSLTVIGKTIEKEMINGKNNYWYLVIPATDEYNACILRDTLQFEGWIFGEYIELKE
ncbi:hypothetical protein EHQ94_10910 [Leptospira meyeri]|uniref:hypothetical protein n=1 Tax=Leptospira meyeri TaxID=29508 RepID=UPI001083880D|nr:hypothetical protein [Leptospira meyeri]TGM66484.1 hypothetical protein EHQ94_10910 [Leptospira meyeri]